MQISEQAPIDPQLDANVLIKLQSGTPEFVAYARANQLAGLSYSLATRAEFLAPGHGTRAQLRSLSRQYRIRLIKDVTLPQIHATGARLQAAFHGDLLNRFLREADARIMATAFVKNERLATGDLQFYKRAKDLGLAVDFVGTGPASARAAAYSARLVRIP